MKLRLLIPAAIAAFATYTALVRDDLARQPATLDPPWPPTEPPAPAAPSAVIRPTEPPPAPSTPTLPSPYLDLAPPPAWDPDRPSMYDVLAGEPTGELGDVPGPLPSQMESEPDPWPTEPMREPESVDRDLAPAGDMPAEPAPAEASTPDPWVTPLDEGRFALGGWAAAAGHTIVSAVTYRRRLPVEVPADRIRLSIESADNVPDDGLVILSDPGFAPDRDGFTLCLVAAEPGPFSAAGSYRVMPAGDGDGPSPN